MPVLPTMAAYVHDRLHFATKDSAGSHIILDLAIYSFVKAGFGCGLDGPITVGFFLYLNPTMKSKHPLTVNHRFSRMRVPPVLKRATLAFN